MSFARSYKEFINIAITELLEAGILRTDKFRNSQEFHNYYNSKGCYEFWCDDREDTIEETINGKEFSCYGKLKVHNMLCSTTFGDVKGVSIYIKKNNVDDRLIPIWLKDGTVAYHFSSWKFPIIKTQYTWWKLRSQEDCDNTADAWDCSEAFVTTSDYRPWPICYNMNYLPQPNIGNYVMGSKIFFDIKDLKKVFEEEKAELIRCIPIAKKMAKEYNESVKASREIMKEANRLKREAALKAQEAKNVVLNAKAKINYTYTRKELLKKDF